MRIPTQSTISATEVGLANLGPAAGQERLKLPKGLKHLAGGAEIALVQLIVTWAQLNSPRLLETYLSDETAPIEDLVRRLPGLVAILCADDVLGTGNLALTEVAKQIADARFDRLYGPQPGQAFRGNATEILCLDHIGKGFPFLLYSARGRSGPKLRPREEFRTLADWLLERTTPTDYLVDLDPMSAEAIGGMLYEAFKNTEDHALVDENGDTPDVSVRALKTNRYSMLPGELVSMAEDYSPLADYFGTLSARRGGVQTHFVEISIMDSGPGFAPSWTQKALVELSDEEEEAAVVACFGRGSAKGDSRFGEGLPHVLRLLRKQRGFLRLRTGRMSFYVDFSSSDTAEGKGLKRHAREAQLARVAGSALTIILPLDR